MRSTPIKIVVGVSLGLLCAAALVGCPEEPAEETGGPAADAGPDVANQGPTVSITAPEPGALRVAGASLELRGTVVDDQDASSELTVLWSSSVDGELGAGQITDDGVATLQTSALAAGEHTITLRATDSAGASADATTAVVLVALPDAPVVSIAPEEPNTTHTLTASLEASPPPEGSEVEWAYAWTVDGADAGIEGPEVPAGETERGQAWEVSVVGVVLGLESPPTTASVVIGNAPPVCAEALLLPVAPSTQDPIVCGCPDASDPDEDPVAHTCSFTADGEPVDGEEDGGCTLPALAATRGQEVRCVLTPTDGTEPGTEAAAAPVTVVNSAPSPPEVVISPAVGGVTTSFECAIEVPSDDADGDELDYAVVWSVGGSEVGVGAAFMPAEVGALKGQGLTCTATASDGEADSEPGVSPELKLGNSPPIGGTAMLGPPIATEETTLTCAGVGATDPDTDPITWTYRWFVGGAELAGWTQTTLTGAWFDAGDEVRCHATSHDLEDDGPTVASPAVVIGNTAPSLASVTLTPGEVNRTQSLQCGWEGAADVDAADTISMIVAWLIDGQVLGGATSETLAAATLEPGDTVSCRVTPHDGTDAGPTLTSSPSLVVNAAPTLEGAEVVPSPLTTISTASCAPIGFEDLEGDPPTWKTSWTIGGKSAGTKAELGPAQLAKGNAVTCSLTVSDPWDVGPTVESLAVVVANTPPSIGGATISLVAGGYECVASGAKDLDGDEVEILRTWTVGGGIGTPDVAGLLPLMGLKHGQTIGCLLTPDDGEAPGDAVAADGVAHEGQPPSVGFVSIKPYPLTAAKDAICEPNDVFDPEGAEVSLAYAWAVDDAPIEGADGETLDSSHYVRGQIVACTVTPSDADGPGEPRIGSRPVTNAPPAVASASIEPNPAVASDVLLCVPDGWSDADGDEPGYHFSWLVGGKPVIGATASTLAAPAFAQGDSVRCFVVPDDGFGKNVLAGVASETLTISNGPPTVADAVISPSNATEASELACSAVDPDDPDGDPVTVEIAWLVNGEVVEGVTGSIDGLYFDKGDEVICRVTPKDPSGPGTPVDSAPLIVANSTPHLTGPVTLTPSDPTTTSVLTCNEPGFEDPDDDEPGYVYGWIVNGDFLLEETASTLESAAFHKGQSVACRVTPTDGVAYGPHVTSSAVTILNTAPTAGGASVTPPEPVATAPLACLPTGFADIDKDPEGWVYAWIVAEETLLEQTGPTLGVGAFSKGQKVRCVATPDDGDALGTAVISEDVLILNSPPTMTGVAIEPAKAYTVTPLTCAATGFDDADQDPVGWHYSWSVGEDLLDGEEGATLAAEHFVKGQLVTCTAAPWDGEVEGVGATAAAVGIKNSVPSAVSTIITPAAPDSTTTLTCAPSGFSDPDDDPEGWRYAWWVNQSPVVGADGPELSGAFARDNEVVCAATPDDGAALGSLVLSPAVTIVNAAPTVPAVQVSPQTGDRDEPFTCTHDEPQDVDDDPLSVTFAWELAGALVDGATQSSFVPGAAASVGDSVVCLVTAHDLEGPGPATASPPSFVENSPPLVVSTSVVSSDGEHVYTDSALTCVPSEVIDPDGDEFELTFTWLVDQEVVDGASADALSDPEAFAKGQKVTCVVVASDIAASGPPSTALVRLVENSPPTLDKVSMTPEEATVGTTFECVASGFEDADGDPEDYRYSWVIGGSVLSGQTEPTLTPGHFVKGQSVACRARAHDGEVAGGPLDGPEVIVDDSPPQIGGVEITPEGATATDELTCTATGVADADDDPVDLEYAWTVAGQPVGDGAKTLPAALFTKGLSVVCAVTGTAAGVAVGPVESEPLIIANTPPKILWVELKPTEAVHGTPFSCAADADDADEEEPTIAFAWLLDGEVVDGETGKTLTLELPKATKVQCRATATDSDEPGAPKGSNIVTIANSAPFVVDAAVAPVTGAMCDTFTCEVELDDPDPADDPTAGIQWVMDGSVVEGAVGETLEADLLPGSWVQCVVTPFDGEEKGKLIASAKGTVDNTAPALGSVLVTPAQPLVGEELTCAPQGFYDAECDPTPAWTIEWLAGEQAIEGEGGDTLDTTGLARDTVVTCRATPTDGFLAGDPVDGAVTIQNRAPVAGAVELVVGADSFTCQEVEAGTDDEALVATYFWRIDDQAEFEDEATIGDFEAPPCGIVRCRQVVSDGQASASSAEVSGQKPSDECGDTKCHTFECYAEGGCEPIPISCDDSESCTIDDCEVGTGCVASIAVHCTECADAAECDDLDPCTADSCQAAGTTGFCVFGAGACTACETAADCEDAAGPNLCVLWACQIQDGQTTGICESTPRTCFDAQACTEDVCDPTAGCQFPLSDAGCACEDVSECSDGNPCTTDTCEAGACVHALEDCDDTLPCTFDYCDPATALCEHLSDPGCASGGSTCLVDADCAVEDACLAARCREGACLMELRRCHDYDSCTVDGCDAASGCVFDAPPPGCEAPQCAAGDDCEDDDACTINACDGGTCQAEVDVDLCGGAGACDSSLECADGDACTLDACEQATATCIHTPVGCLGFGGCALADGVCLADVGCVFLPDPACSAACSSDAECDTGSACSAGTCDDGACTVAVMGCDDGDPCTFDVCDEVAGECGVLADPSCGGAPCQAHADCPAPPTPGCATSLCVDGACEVVAMACSDHDPCTVDACDEVAGACVFSPIADCQGCAVGADCDDGNACTSGVCDKGECSFAVVSGCGACAVDEECTAVAGACVLAQCLGGACYYHTVADACTECDLAGPAAQCNDFVACTFDECHPTLGVCLHTEDISFAKGNPPECVPDLCTSHRECDDGNACSIDRCQLELEWPTCVSDAVEGVECPVGCGTDAQCADGDPCTVDRCTAGTCQWLLAACTDGLACTTDSPCVPGRGCQHPPDPECAAPCASDAECATGSGCQLGQCVNGQCALVALGCGDLDPCTAYLCDDGACLPAVVAACDWQGCSADADCAAVFGAEADGCSVFSCVEGACVSEPVVCDDHDLCTVDECEAGICTFALEPGCTGACGKAEDCADGDARTDDRCEDSVCVNEYHKTCTRDVDCHDLDACTWEACLDGVCQRKPILCHDDLPCTKDFAPCGGIPSDLADDLAYPNCPEGGEPLVACLPTQGCFQLPLLSCEVECTSDADCETGHLCYPGTCEQGQCVAAPTQCADPGPDKQSFCDYQTGACTVVDNPGWTFCDDHFDCRHVTGFTVEYTGGEEEVGGWDLCSQAFCDLGTPIQDGPQCLYFSRHCNDLNPCTVDGCDPQTGCVFTPIAGCKGCATDEDCSDFDDCTTDTCDGDSGQCTNEPVPGCRDCLGETQAFDCYDADECTEDRCDVEGACYHVAIAGCGEQSTCVADTECADEDPCTVDRCDATTGVCANVATPCVDEFACTSDGPQLCTPERPGCTPTLDDTCGGEPCEADVDCDFPDACVIGTCLDGECLFTALLCDDGEPNSLDYCDSQTGACAAQDFGAPWDGCNPTGDGSECDFGDPCSVASCMPTTSNPGDPGQCLFLPVSCNDFDACTTDTCVPDVGCVFTPNGGCQGCSADEDCDDGDACTTDTCGGEGAPQGNCVHDPKEPLPPGCEL